jgi:peroxiredoxin
MILGLLVVLVTSPLALTWYIHHHSSHHSFPPGMMVPSFVVSTINGTIFSLTCQGKKHIIIFFSADCSSCRDELSNVKILYPPYKSKIDFFAISLSTLEKTKMLVSSQNFPFPVFLWKRTAGQNSMTIVDVPTMLFIDEQRIIRNEYVGARTLTEDKTLIHEFCEDSFMPKR